MAQPPLLVDEVRIEPGSGDVLRIYRDALTGALTFADPVFTTGVTLQQLGSLPIGNILTVGPTGTGAQYNSITGAAAVVPATSGPTEPWVILVGPGVYKETINLVRDWVFVVGLGGAIVQSLAEDTPNAPSADHTIIIGADLGTVPRHIVLQNLTITNAHDNKAPVCIVGGAASEVGLEGIHLINTQIQATGAGFPIKATSANHILMQGGTFRGSSATSLVTVSECASFILHGVEETTALQLDYDTSQALPSESGSEYRLQGVGRVGVGSSLSPPVSSDLRGAGSLSITNCGQVNNTQVSGDRSLEVLGSALGDLTLVGVGGTTTARLVGSSRGTLTTSTATIEEPVTQGSESLAAVATQPVTFLHPQPDGQYNVALELGGSPGAATHWITGKSGTGFTINFTAPVTLGANWTAVRSM
jgi:hypothetical protein